MMMDIADDEAITKSDVFIVEVKLNDFMPRLFTLMIMGSKKDYVLHSQGNLLFYDDLSKTNDVLATHLSGVLFGGLDTYQCVQKCYPEEVIRLIQEVDSVSDSLVLDTINSLLDFTNTLSASVPEKFRMVLREFADCMTFETEYEKFFLNATYQRNDVVDAIYWSVGFLVSRIELIEVDKQNQTP